MNSAYSLVLAISCCGHLSRCFLPPDDPPTPDPDDVAPYVNSSEFLAKWLENPANRKMVEPIDDCITGTIPKEMHTNSPDAKDWSKYNTNVTLTTLPYVHIESRIRQVLESHFPPPDSVNFTFVKALFIPLTKPKLMYRLLVISDKFHNVPMFDRHNITSSIVDSVLKEQANQYKHEEHCFVFTHDEWNRKKNNFMEVYSTLFYKIPKTAEIVTFGPYGRRKKRSGTQSMILQDT